MELVGWFVFPREKKKKGTKSMYDVLHLFAFKTSQDLFIVRNALVINAEAGNQ